MRYTWILLLVGLFVVASCAQSNVLTGDAIGNSAYDVETVGDTTPGSPSENQDDTLNSDVETITSDTDPSSDSSEKTETDINSVTEVPAYTQFKNQCSQDSKGVVRVFDDSGKKTVYRNTCLVGILTDYSCESGKLLSENKRCTAGCKTTPYGAVCK